MIATRDSDWTKMFNRRAAILGGAQAAMVATLVGRMYYLQVLQADRYRTLADENRINIQLLPPPRGRILDRFGQQLAANKQQFQVMVIPEQAPKIGVTLEVLSHLIELPEYERERIKKEVGRKRSFVPVTIKQNLTWEEMARIQVNAPDLPGIIVDEGLTRYYPIGGGASHLLGYVAAVDEADLTGDPLLQLPGFKIGKLGVEKIYDMALRGKGGTSEIEVNAVGRAIRELERHEGEPGADVTLTIDERLQRYAAERLETESASVNVMDIYTGEMLVMLSNPSFDPHIFTRGATPAEWKELSTNTHSPMINKSIAGRYPPGSTFKTVTALAALEHGIAGPDTVVSCAGHTEFGGRRWYCWAFNIPSVRAHGPINMIQAIAQSCDCYFYEMARRLGVDRVAETARKLGLGDITGVGLPGEQKGLMPTEAWKKAATGEPWQPGENLNIGIGQGQVTVTPIQLVQLAARIANGGLAVKPTLIRKGTQAGGAATDGTQLESLGFSPQNLAVIHEGMFDVINGARGTARLFAKLKFTDPERKAWTMSGKSGSVQTHRITKADREAGVKKQEELPWEERDHALFIAYAPSDQPRYAISIVVEHGAHGSDTASPIVRDIMQKVLDYDPSRKPRVEEDVVASIPAVTTSAPAAIPANAVPSASEAPPPTPANAPLTPPAGGAQ